MEKLRPHLRLIKPRIRRAESCDEAEALRFLRSWTRARTRLAIVRLSDHLKTIEVTQPKPKRAPGATAA